MHAAKSSNYWNAVAEVDIPSKTDMDSVHFSIDLLKKMNGKNNFGIHFERLLCDCANKWTNSDNGWHVCDTILSTYRLNSLIII